MSLLQVLTASRLLDGEVVFWSGERWGERFGEARLFVDPAEVEAVLAQARARPTETVEPYAIDVRRGEDGGVAPVSFRERIRALGPTDHLELGKQAEGGDTVETLRRAAGAARSTGRLDLIRRK